MFIEWPLKGPFNTHVHLPLATEDSSNSVVEFSHVAITTMSL